MHSTSIILEIQFPKKSRGKSTTNNFNKLYISFNIFDTQAFKGYQFGKNVLHYNGSNLCSLLTASPTQ